MALPHEVLGVAANADEHAINAAFRKAVKRFHPDLNNGDTSGIRCLQRLITARDFLTSPGWRAASVPRSGSLLPSSRKKRITRSVVLTFAVTGTCAFMLLSMFGPGEAKDNPPAISMARAGPAGISVVKKSRIANARIPGAGSAEIKDTRDLRGAATGRRLDAGELTGRLLQASAERRESSSAGGVGKAVKGAAHMMAQAFQKIAPEL
jgi:hypothetical protein